MKLGMFTPVVVQHPASSSVWERSAGIEDLARIAEAAG